MTDRSRWFVSTDWLARHLGQPDVAVIDASWHLPTENRDPEAEYLAGHIPGAVRFNIDEIADRSTDLPHMLPKPDAFAAAMRQLGIGQHQTVVVYDSVGLFSAPRVWWTLKVFGIGNAFILDGGLPAWKAEHRPLETGAVTRQPSHFAAQMNHAMVRGRAEVAAALASGTTVVDARPAPRFRGEAAEPRPGVRSGHMPGAHNVPAGQLVEGGRLIDAERLKAAFLAGGVHIGDPVITSCGSGVTAAILWLALETIGQPRASLGLYDGSWAEWGSRDDTAIVTG